MLFPRPRFGPRTWLPVLGILLLGEAGAGTAPEVRPSRLRLDAYLAEVEAANPVITSARRRASAASHRAGPAGVPADPFVAVGPDAIPTRGGNPGLVRYQVSQAIPFPGKLRAAAEAVAERSEAASADADTVVREVRLSAVQTFYRTFHNQRSIELVDDLRKLVDEAVASGKARYETGSPSHHEWLLARADLGVLDTERTRLESARGALVAQMNELRDQPPDASLGELAAEDLLAPGGAQASGPVEGSSSPELRSLDAILRATDADRRSARLGYLPDFVLQGMAEQPIGSMNEEKPMWGAMVGVSVPVFWRWKQDELLAAADREREAAAAEQRALINRLRAEEVAARRDWQATRQVVELYEKSVLPLTELALDSARTGYALGRVSLSDFIATARVHRTQQLELLAARIDVALAKARIENPLSAPPLLRLAPATPTLFGGGMGGGMSSGASGMPPSAVRLGPGIGIGAARGAPAAKSGTSSGMGGM